MIDNNAQYSGLANIMNMRDRNPNTQLAYVSNGYLNSVPTAPNPYTGIPQVNSPIAMNEGGMPSQQYPMQEEASELAERGRYGDTTLVHMTPGEVQGLASLGQLTINPDTGLPEAFSLGNILPIVANVGLAIATGGMSLPAQMAIMGAANFGMGLMQGQSAEQALFSGLTSAATTGIFSGLSSTLSGAAGKTVAGAGEQAAAQAAQQAAAGSATQAAAEQAAWGAFGDLGSTFAANPATGIPPLSSQLASQSVMMADPNLIINTATGPSFGAELANVIGTPEVVNVGITPAQAGVEGFGRSGEFFAKPAGIKLDKAIEPNWFQRNVLGETTSYAKGDIVPFSEFEGKGIFGGDIPYQDMGLEERISANITNPASYAPIATAALTGAFKEPYEYEKPPARPAPIAVPPKTLKGGEVIRPVATEKELTEMALKGGRRNYFTPYRYAAEGGLIGLQQGGMPTPQAPSAMAGMLAQPQPQQPLPINVQVQPQQPVIPQQPQPSMPMPPQQMGSGVTPLPDQQKEFMKLMDMEDQVQSQKRSQSTQALANLMGLGMNFAGSQYPQTSPSGQAVQPPPTPAMNYGSQVNLGSTGGFAQGGVIDRAEGGPTRAEFDDFMKSISNTGAGLFMRISGLDKQMESQLPVGGGGAESMNRLLSRDVYNNTSSSAPSPVQSPSGSESMNQLLSRPEYSKQVAEGGFLGYNQGGMPSQSQPYFEGEVQGPGDGQSDEVAFRVDGGQVDGAMLSPQEYVLAADVVSAIGNGSSDAGAAKLDQFMKGVRQDAYGTTKQMQPFNNQGLTNLVA